MCRHSCRRAHAAARPRAITRSSLLESGLEWDYVTELRERWDVPVIVKGLVTAEDADLACQYGAAGVVVSNHGGRQLDGAIASLEALPEVVDAVGGPRGGVPGRRGAARHRRRHGARARCPRRARRPAGAVRARVRRLARGRAGTRDRARGDRERSRAPRLPLARRGDGDARVDEVPASGRRRAQAKRRRRAAEGALEAKLALEQTAARQARHRRHGPTSTSATGSRSSGCAHSRTRATSAC